MNIKTYYYTILIVIFAFLLSLNHIKVFSLDDMGLFLTVIGLVYGLISAFTISNAWERFSKIRDSISAETSSLENFYLFGKSLSDKAKFNIIKDKLLIYLEDVPTIEWGDYWKSENTHKKFRDIVEFFPSVVVEGDKEVEIFDDMGDELRSASTARTAQLVLSQTRLTKIQWILNLFLSSVLVVSIVFLELSSPLVTIFIVTTMLVSILMILLVIYELDSLKIAEQEVSVDPYHKLAKIIKEDN